MNNTSANWTLRALSALLLVSTMIACESITTTKDPVSKSSLLPPGAVPANTVGIEIFLIRVTPPQQPLVRQLWQEVDEQMVAPMLRHELREQGFRVGVQGSYLSASLAQLLKVTADRPGDVLGESMNEIAVADIAADPDVSRQFRNLLPGMRAVFRPFDDTIEELSLFWHEDGRLCGKTYKDAQGLISLSARRRPDGTVRFELVPELEYGLSETRIRFQQGVAFHETGKPRRVFEPLTIALDLLPGQWIILGPTSSDCSGIGRDFFLRGVERNEQKLIAVRLAHVKSEPGRGDSVLPATENRDDYAFPERN